MAKVLYHGRTMAEMKADGHMVIEKQILRDKRAEHMLSMAFLHIDPTPKLFITH